MATQRERLDEETVDRLYDELYATQGKHLEAEHRGEYLAVSQDGRIMLGSTLHDVGRQAAAAFGPGIFLYKVGEPAIGKWR